ncbi:SepM family pheromone-processing serine protease [Ectobacillus polymachus]|uniref:SepM family pheromone-processing serine protease n=1 Tax=Ectobacillus polymachus TaxID=1508806 RepID=UPI003A83EE25
MNKRLRYVYAFLAVVLLLAATYIPLPYYITKPGLVEKLGPYVKVDGGQKEKGDFMLVTVSMSQATIIDVAMAKLNKYYEIYKKDDIVGKEENNQQYQFQQSLLMNESQNAAIYNAYEKANKSVHVENRGVLVVSIADGMPAFEKLQLGDQLTAVDSKVLTTAEEFIAYMKTKKSGDQVKIEFVRDGVKHTETFTLQPLKDGSNRAGIGIEIATDQALQVDPNVKIDTNRIGGPSAGLMFTLEIYNQLSNEDLTKGYEVAGTGTINSKGEIGPIGGIQQKIVAADKAGAQIFFAPNEGGNAHSNYHDAVAAAQDIHSKMKIVPVDTLEDALHYLQSLPPLPVQK